MSRSRQFTMLFTLSLLLSGCVSQEAEVTPPIEEEPIPMLEVQQVPNWAATAHDGQNFNKSSLALLPYVAYFSAPWCLHCEATLDTYDQVIPEGLSLIHI